VVIADAIEFLTSRGHAIDKLTDYEIQDTFEAAFDNWQHDLVERARLPGSLMASDPAKWNEFIDDLHKKIESKEPPPNAATKLLDFFMRQGVPIRS
jgi:hypothetical protein